MRADVYEGRYVERRRVGCVDGDGDVYRGSEYSLANKVGHVFEDGDVYRGSDYSLANKVGHVLEDGDVYRGSDNSNRVGRIDQGVVTRRAMAGAALLLLLSDCAGTRPALFQPGPE
jgi:hypothetical protein